ncbi:MAG: hypothetical protein E7616_00765 [Ruminococcaceae bacterium]|nr:hypothetical protein [Oscillospiraceae bacterium]
MAIKMKILHYPENGKMTTFANGLSEVFDVKSDKIPPAYNCDKDRLLIAGISTGKTFSADLSMFLRGLSKDRVQNVAIFTDSNDEVIATMKSYIEGAGAKVVDVKKVKGSFLPFLKGVKPEEMADLKAWANEVIENLK